MLHPQLKLHEFDVQSLDRFFELLAFELGMLLVRRSSEKLEVDKRLVVLGMSLRGEGD